MSKKEKYIVIKPLYMSIIKVSCPVGTIIAVDRDNSIMTIKNKEYNDLKDIDIALSIKSQVVIPYKESKEIKAILESVKIKLESKTEKKQMPVVFHDSDLNGEIDISYTKYRDKVTEKTGSLEVIKEIENTIPIAKRVEKDLINKVEEIYNRPKMKVVREGEDNAGRSLKEISKATSKAPKSSITMKRVKK